MKKVLSFVLAAFYVPLFAANIDSVYLQYSLTNKHDVMVITVKGSHGSLYTLSCNRDESSCRSPLKGIYYQLRDSSNSPYRCQGVELATMSGSDQVVGQYCLLGVE